MCSKRFPVVGDNHMYRIDHFPFPFYLYIERAVVHLVDGNRNSWLINGMVFAVPRNFAVLVYRLSVRVDARSNSLPLISHSLKAHCQFLDFSARNRLGLGSVEFPGACERTIGSAKRQWFTPSHGRLTHRVVDEIN